MIVAQIDAETGNVKREVSRSGDRVTVTLIDGAGHSVMASLDSKGNLAVTIQHPGAPTKAGATEGGYAVGYVVP